MCSVATVFGVSFIINYSLLGDRDRFAHIFIFNNFPRKSPIFLQIASRRVIQFYCGFDFSNEQFISSFKQCMINIGAIGL